ncbi:MAG: hypothetical protein VW474_10750 [Paracoccaceae bacterium]
MTVPKQFILFACLLALSSAAFSHSGGLNKQGCHAGSQPYHCHGKQNSATSNVPKAGTKLTGIVTHVRDGDTVEVDGIPIRLAALDCPEKVLKKVILRRRLQNNLKG